VKVVGRWPRSLALPKPVRVDCYGRCFERGLATVRQHAAISAGEAVIEPIDLFVFRA
jgi:hypothetical protein